MTSPALWPPRPVPPEARTEGNGARTLTLVAIVLFAVFGAIFLLIGGLVASVAGPVGALFLFLAVVPFLFLVLTFFLVHQRLGRGEYDEAATAALILGILSLLFGGGLPGVFLLVAYAKANAAERMIQLAQRLLAQRPPPPPEQAPAPSPGTGSPQSSGDTLPGACPSCGATVDPRARFCTHCGVELKA